jgi:hypothetical protein
MGIKTHSGFEILTPTPLDLRVQTATTITRDAIPAIKRYEGMQVYVIADTKTYVLKGGVLNANWVELGAAGGGGGALYDFCCTQGPLDLGTTIPSDNVGAVVNMFQDVQWNIGSIYNTTTGRITLPVDGILSLNLVSLFPPATWGSGAITGFAIWKTNFFGGVGATLEKIAGRNIRDAIINTRMYVDATNVKVKGLAGDVFIPAVFQNSGASLVLGGSTPSGTTGTTNNANSYIQGSLVPT